MFVPKLQSMRPEGWKSNRVEREGDAVVFRKTGIDSVSSCGRQLRDRVGNRDLQEKLAKLLHVAQQNSFRAARAPPRPNIRCCLFV